MMRCVSLCIVLTINKIENAPGPYRGQVCSGGLLTLAPGRDPVKGLIKQSVTLALVKMPVRGTAVSSLKRRFR